MGQVPQSSFINPVLIIGNGRVARHFFFYLQSHGIPCVQWYRSSGQDLESLCREHSPRIVLVLIHDTAIEGWIREHTDLSSRTVVHFSGALVTPLALGMHPLMSFGPDLYDLSFYEHIPFIGEEGKPSFRDLFPNLKNPVYSIPSSEKAYYHALCVLSGNFTVILWQKLFHAFEPRLKLAPSVAKPYLDQVMRNLQNNPIGALTGPLQRGDVRTIDANLKALDGDLFQEIYQSFVDVYQKVQSEVQK